MKRTLHPSENPAGVIGLGLMGHSIIACLLAAGHRVVGVTRKLAGHGDTPAKILALLRELKRERMMKGNPAQMVRSLTLTEDYSGLADCAIVIESIIEDIASKKETYRAVEAVVGPKTIIGSNTSSIPLSILQSEATRPDRFIGIHWDEPAHVTRFLEVIAGAQTSRAIARKTMALAEAWGKEPSLVRRDVRGFITNRISYAMFREACYLVDQGIATVEDVDRSLRNDVGWWMPFAGPFRYMDLMGPHSYYRVMKDLLPDLSTGTEIPLVMREVVDSGGRGIANNRGFYRYTKAESIQWEKLFLKFNYEIRKLTSRYPCRLEKAVQPKSSKRPSRKT